MAVNLQMLFRCWKRQQKHTTSANNKYHDLSYYVARIQRRKRYVELRWFDRHFRDHEIIVKIDNPNIIHAFNRFEEEGHVEQNDNHFRLIYLTREELYSLGVPGILDIEMFVDREEQNWFKWTQVGKFLGIEDIRTSLNGLEKCEILTRQEFVPTRHGTPGWSRPKDQQSKTDKFHSAFGVMYVIVKSQKDKGKALRK